MAQSSIFTDIPHLTDEFVDANNAKLEMETLRDLCLAYNNSHTTTDSIEIDEKSSNRHSLPFREDRIAMILALWMRNVTIPESITLASAIDLSLQGGSPYDEGLKEALLTWTKKREFVFIIDGVPTCNFPLVRETAFYKVIAKPEQLAGYLSASIQARYCDFDGAKEIKEAYSKKLSHLLGRLGINPIEHRLEITYLLGRLKTIDLIYILLVGTMLTEYKEVFGEKKYPNAFGYALLYYPVC